jgi:hypothetical protein
MDNLIVSQSIFKAEKSPPTMKRTKPEKREPKKPRILWFSEITVLSLSEATQLGHFQFFWKNY